MIQELNKDIFEAPINMLAHQCNCFHTMGGGIAKVIAAKFPQVKKDDYTTPFGNRKKMGTVRFIKVDGSTIGNKDLQYVANIYGQFDCSSLSRQTEYDHLFNGLELLEKSVRGNGVVVGVPYRIGCGLAGGSWRVVRAMLDEVFLESSVQLVICHRPGD